MFLKPWRFRVIYYIAINNLHEAFSNEERLFLLMFGKASWPGFGLL